ncbi:MAG: hypothetical protein BA874_07000 [Desulfuromonadales bacterium C00003068]|jgi:hypothetical protein|nr:MAG: hypothetical protein BA874_07000 [Desulfuromonadales bacterium C00003068]
MKKSTKRLLILLIILLSASVANANNGPDSVTYAQESSQGPVIFDHESHGDFVENGCNNIACHGASGVKTKIILNKKTAHGKMCRTCHSHTNKIEGDIVAPIKCLECHLKGNMTPTLCLDGQQSSDCKKCHK